MLHCICKSWCSYFGYPVYSPLKKKMNFSPCSDILIHFLIKTWDIVCISYLISKKNVFCIYFKKIDSIRLEIFRRWCWMTFEYGTFVRINHLLLANEGGISAHILTIKLVSVKVMMYLGQEYVYIYIWANALELMFIV